MHYIRVWCDYDIGGRFGADCNEEIFRVWSSSDVYIEGRVIEHISNVTKIPKEELKGSYGWELLGVVKSL